MSATDRGAVDPTPVPLASSAAPAHDASLHTAAPHATASHGGMAHDPGLPDPAVHEPTVHEPTVHDPSVHAVTVHDPGANAATSYEAAGELLRALAAPIRIAIVTELGHGSRCVHEIVEAVGAPQPLVSQHLRVLRGAGVVRGQRRGREIAYSLTDEHIGHIVADAITHAREPR